MDKKFLIPGVVVVGIILVIFAFSKFKNRDVEAPVTAGNPQEVFDSALNLQKSHELQKAKETLQELMSNYPSYEDMENVQQKLEEINMELILSNAASPKTVLHEVQSGDTLGKVAKKYGSTVELIKKKNNLKNDVIRLGQKLYVWTGVFNIFVDKSQNILILKEGDEVIKVYNVSTGSNNITPIGTYKVTSKLVDPVWFKAGAVIPPESPQNVLGTRWMGFDLAGYGIHGTTEPDKIGEQVTAGCVRMRNQEVEELYDLIPVGTQVVIVD